MLPALANTSFPLGPTHTNFPSITKSLHQALVSTVSPKSSTILWPPFLSVPFWAIIYTWSLDWTLLFFIIITIIIIIIMLPYGLRLFHRLLLKTSAFPHTIVLHLCKNQFAVPVRPCFLSFLLCFITWCTHSFSNIT